MCGIVDTLRTQYRNGSQHSERIRLLTLRAASIAVSATTADAYRRWGNSWRSVASTGT